eukprot:CAMPEP_0177216250 /NCGR_PEP_ID=MMETSP0367-20130122/34656_1 /TAXON_ID=447022 ORGANISM="Scrippsiella hangoei-like, Strain SHHI-4" /NCGR_SAMPLE_ID=MMETSP0367 /ASSEMBLY_ACC=CAM_ASM_000362 /LENGTH=112 /DNA_ID=CAMNT_0018665751 /DNA_START=238 /DNA_END=574 /DNA_ORIENTATION=-
MCPRTVLRRVAKACLALGRADADVLLQFAASLTSSASAFSLSWTCSFVNPVRLTRSSDALHFLFLPVPAPEPAAAEPPPSSKLAAPALRFLPIATPHTTTGRCARVHSKAAQ